jgi:hypothetical protein
MWTHMTFLIVLRNRDQIQIPKGFRPNYSSNTIRNNQHSTFTAAMKCTSMLKFSQISNQFVTNFVRYHCYKILQEMSGTWVKTSGRYARNEIKWKRRTDGNYDCCMKAFLAQMRNIDLRSGLQNWHASYVGRIAHYEKINLDRGYVILQYGDKEAWQRDNTLPWLSH